MSKSQTTALKFGWSLRVLPDEDVDDGESAAHGFSCEMKLKP